MAIVKSLQSKCFFIRKIDGFTIKKGCIEGQLTTFTYEYFVSPDQLHLPANFRTKAFQFD
jgi:hypothetical protein